MRRTAGSSPLARGLHHHHHRRGGRHGIIPARAGFTVHLRFPSVGVRDHPRSRGVYDRRRRKPRCRKRIIPARAGFTRHMARSTQTPSDHPRSRGVYPALTHPHPPSIGSSPLARGLPRGTRSAWPLGRIIPARAGFTGFSLSLGSSSGDHPRSRGVYPPRTGTSSPTPGSSPLARGLRSGFFKDMAAARIIPARAGFTRSGRRTSGRDGDHPRSRGVYRFFSRHASYPVGSSPLARGLRARLLVQPSGHGIIPARAGFT